MLYDMELMHLMLQITILLIYCHRSAVRLLKNDTQGALEDALRAAHLAPRWHTVLLKQE